MIREPLRQDNATTPATFELMCQPTVRRKRYDQGRRGARYYYLRYVLRPYTTLSQKTKRNPRTAPEDTPSLKKRLPEVAEIEDNFADELLDEPEHPRRTKRPRFLQETKDDNTNYHNDPQFQIGKE